MNARSAVRIRRVAAIVGQLLTAAPAFGAPTASEKAAAEALFKNGTELMQQQSYAEACSKFEASSAIEPGLGVKLWLADCYDRVGRTASAWALFSESAAMAQKSGQDDRARAATQRASELETRLSKLELAPPPDGLPEGASVALDGTAIPAGSVGSSLPVDPGDHTVVVSAPGYKSLTLQPTVPAGPASIRVEIIALTPAPKPRPTVAKSAAPPEATSSPGHTQRLVAYSLGGLGIASLAGSAVLGLRAQSLNNQSLDHCLANEPNACDEQGATLRGQAQNFGNFATAAAITGGALVATGVVLLLTAPTSEKQIHVGGWVSPTGQGLFVGGRL